MKTKPIFCCFGSEKNVKNIKWHMMKGVVFLLLTDSPTWVTHVTWMQSCSLYLAYTALPLIYCLCCHWWLRWPTAQTTFACELKPSDSLNNRDSQRPYSVWGRSLRKFGHSQQTFCPVSFRLKDGTGPPTVWIFTTGILESTTHTVNKYP